MYQCHNLIYRMETLHWSRHVCAITLTLPECCLRMGPVFTYLIRYCSFKVVCVCCNRYYVLLFQNGNTALAAAVSKNCYDMVQTLLIYKANVNVTRVSIVWVVVLVCCINEVILYSSTSQVSSQWDKSRRLLWRQHVLVAISQLRSSSLRMEPKSTTCAQYVLLYEINVTHQCPALYLRTKFLQLDLPSSADKGILSNTFCNFRDSASLHMGYETL